MFVVLVGFLLITAALIVTTIDFPISDFFSFWLAGRMVLSGEDPYSPQAWAEGHMRFEATWRSDPTFLYPIPVAILFAPLGLLPEEQALIGWVFLLELMILLSGILLMGRLGLGRLSPFAFPLVAGLALFRPTWALLLSGQFSGLLLLACALAVFLWVRGQWFAGGAAMAFLLLKPSIGIPVIALTAGWLIVQRKSRALLGLATAALVLVLVTLPVRPGWPSEFLTIATTKLTHTFGFTPTVWGLSAYLSGYAGLASIGIGLLATCVLLIVWGFVILHWRGRIDPGLGLGLTLCVALLATPYAWPYDQILLVIPILLIVSSLITEGRPFLIAASFFLLVDGLAVVLVLASMPLQMEVWSALLPLAVFLAGLLVLLTKKAEPLAKDSARELDGQTNAPSLG